MTDRWRNLGITGNHENKGNLIAAFFLIVNSTHR